MEITRHNFKEKYGDISKAVKSADFVAIDGEFTGLGTTSCQIHAFDTPESRYQKLRKGMTDILLIQFGMCTFHYDQDLKKYVSQAFNFYVFPRPFSRQAPDTRFLCQSSSIEFLASQGFDFNKLFRDGISYLSLEDEQSLRDSLKERHEKLSSKMTSPSFTTPSGDLLKGPMVIPEEQKAFIEDICEKVDEFLASDKESLDLLPCNGYLRKLTYSTLAFRYKSSIHLESKTNENKLRYIVVVRVKNEDDFKDREMKKRHAEIEELDDAVGFSKIIKLLSESKKVIVGHNMLLDVLHVLNRFWCPLPEDYKDFKSLLQCVLPTVVDTKLMANSYPFKDIIYTSALGDLQKALAERPFTKPEFVCPENFPSYSTDSERLHEAGYDAYITGICFISMCNYLGTFEIPASKHVPPTSPLLKPFMHRVFLMRVFDIPYMNLTGPDDEPDRSHVFHLTFPKEWKSLDISQLFFPFGSVYIAWLEESSAFVSLNRKDQAENVMKSLPTSDLYKVMPYSEYMRKEEIINHPVKRITGTKRKTPTSDMDVRAKRKRSNEDTPGGKAKIPTIREEDEMEENMETRNDKNIENLSCKSAVAGTGKKDGKLFEEEAQW